MTWLMTVTTGCSANTAHDNIGFNGTIETKKRKANKMESHLSNTHGKVCFS